MESIEIRMKKKAIVVSLKGVKLTLKEKMLLSKEKPWGVILFKRNIKSFWQVKKLTNQIKKLTRDKKFPILGIIYSPITEDFYYAYKNYGAYLMKGHSKAIKIMTKKMSLHDKNNVYTSISINKNVLKEISDNVDNALFIPLASALKFGAIASGNGCFYPRLGPTHEWDTAAGQCLIEEAGGSVVDKFMNRLEYNKNPNFLNEEFFVIADTDYNWKKIIDNIIRSRKVRI